MVVHSHRLSLVVALAVAATTSQAWSQQQTVPDAQVESSVLKALAGVPELADQPIGTTTVYGTVTISGSVSSEDLRNKAEQAVARTVGVKKVVDELTIGAPQSSVPGDQAAANQPADQSTMASEDPQQQPQATSPQGYPAQPGYPQQSAPPQSYPQQQGYPQASGYPAQSQPQATRPQQAGQPVVLPEGTILQVRINQAMDSRHTQAGAPFDGVVLNNIVMNGMIAVPRGARVQGQVIETHPGGDLRGRGVLALQLTQLTLEGQSYPLASQPWTQQGYDKTGQTIGTTAGLGAMGAIIGAIAGGGPGALLGAGIGGVAGLGLSSASHQGEAGMPSEAIVTFRLMQQVSLLTVSQSELDRLAAVTPPMQQGAPPTLQRRYYPYPPPYAGPVGYPYPYYPYRYYGYYR